MFILLAGMAFQSGVTAEGSGPHAALTWTVALVLVTCVGLFMGMLTLEVYRSYRFARRFKVARSSWSLGSAPRRRSRQVAKPTGTTSGTATSRECVTSATNSGTMGQEGSQPASALRWAARPEPAVNASSVSLARSPSPSPPHSLWTLNPLRGELSPSAGHLGNHRTPHRQASLASGGNSDRARERGLESNDPSHTSDSSLTGSPSTGVTGPFLRVEKLRRPPPPPTSPPPPAISGCSVAVPAPLTRTVASGPQAASGKDMGLGASLGPPLEGRSGSGSRTDRIRRMQGMEIDPST